MSKLFVHRPLCESSVFVLGLMVQMESSSLLSASRLRRLRAKAVKQKISTMSSEGGGGNKKLEDQLDFLTKTVMDFSVRLSDACVYVPVWTETVWAEPGMPQWHMKADMCEDVLATSPADYVSLASVVVAGGGKADNGITKDALWESVGEDGDLFSIRAASVCGGCWEVLPDICQCGAVRMCGDCADVFVATGAVVDVVAELGLRRVDGESGNEDGSAT